MKAIIQILILLLPLSSYSQDKISSSNLRADAALLWQAINELHPGTYRHIDTTELQAAYDDLLVEFSEDRTEKEAFICLSEFIVNVKCGHTYLNPFNQRNKLIDSLLTDEVLLPFTFSIIDNQLVVDQTFTDNINKYDVVKCINDIKVGDILDSLSHYIKSDGNRLNKKIKDLEVSLDSKYNYFDYYFSMIYGFRNSVSIEFLHDKIIDVPLINAEVRSVSKNTDENIYDRLWSYSFSDDHGRYN